jgi:hypothetical protein
MGSTWFWACHMHRSSYLVVPSSYWTRTLTGFESHSDHPSVWGKCKVEVNPVAGCFTHGKDTRYPLWRRLDGPQGCLSRTKRDLFSFFFVLCVCVVLEKGLSEPPNFSSHACPSDRDSYGLGHRNQISASSVDIYMSHWHIYGFNWGVCDFLAVLCAGVLFPRQT